MHGVHTANPRGLYRASQSHLRCSAGGYHGFGDCPGGALPIHGDWLCSCPGPATPPGLGSRVGAAAAAAQAVPSPAPLLPGAWGLPACLVAFPSWFSCAPGDSGWEGCPYPSCCAWFCCHHRFSSPWPGGVSPSAAHPMEPVAGVNKADGKGCSLSLHGLASLLSSVRRLCGQGGNLFPQENPFLGSSAAPRFLLHPSPRSSPPQKSPGWSYAKPSCDLGEETGFPILPGCWPNGS